MFLAVILSLVLWSHPPPQLWACNFGHTPTGAPSNCYRVKFVPLFKVILDGPRVS